MRQEETFGQRHPVWAAVIVAVVAAITIGGVVKAALGCHG